VHAPPASAPAASPGVTEVSDEAFGQVAADVLKSTDKGGSRTSRLAGVVRRQLRRADTLMRAGDTDAGQRAVRGAIWLVRAGEARKEMWQGAAAPLSSAAEEAARVGDEGKARALYSLVKQAEPTTAVAAAVDEHLAAMDAFAKSSPSAADLEAAGDAQRVAVQQSLYEPSRPHLENAARKLSEWMQKSLQSDMLERWGDASFDREEAIEAFRARRFGAMTLVATFMRHGSPMDALDWLERNDLGRLLPAEVRDLLEAAGEDDEPKAWQVLYQHFQNESDPSRADSSLGVELAEAAAFGTAIELYRSRPNQLGSVGPLALLLPDVLLGDVVPAVIASAVPGAVTREEASWSLSLTMRAILAHGAVGDIATARRIFESSRNLVARSAKLVQAGESVRPHPARLYAVMASLETRNADLGRARDALKQAIALDPNALLYVELGRVERQLDHLEEAQRSLQLAVTVARKATDLLTESEAQILLFELDSQRGNRANAAQSLRDALNSALAARDRAKQPEEQALAERRLARILELYGEYEGSKRASARALDASRTSNQQRTATIMDSARRALTFGDLAGVRQALRDAIDMGIPAADCVYVALWVRVIEHQQKVPSDGSVEQALARVGDLPPWPSRLKSWVLGTLSDDDIEKSARNEAEKAELKFYQALAVPGARNGEASRRALSEVARSPAVGLVEVFVARDLVRLGEQSTPPRWPEDIRIP
jgi:tetratricopeptide (TPR) repeat protein